MDKLLKLENISCYIIYLLVWYDWNIYFRIFYSRYLCYRGHGTTEEITSSLADIFNGMVYDFIDISYHHVGYTCIDFRTGIF